MELIYNLEIVELADEIVAIPVGENANQFHGSLTINDTAKEILEYIKECTTPEEVHQLLMKSHPDDDPDELGQQLCDFLNLLIKEGLLRP